MTPGQKSFIYTLFIPILNYSYIEFSIKTQKEYRFENYLVSRKLLPAPPILPFSENIKTVDIIYLTWFTSKFENFAPRP